MNQSNRSSVVKAIRSAGMKLVVTSRRIPNSKFPPPNLRFCLITSLISYRLSFDVVHELLSSIHFHPMAILS